MEKGMKWESEPCHYLDKYLFPIEGTARAEAQRQENAWHV